ncbi:MAG TPA: LysR family transcriptional regulator [Beijerinckiaceae bacterium]|jgi:DNA-binding transcriptional LysR family regulator|nr:LysR family transcriptional regulator [Beijerinckiaceae bacterium]
MDRLDSLAIFVAVAEEGSFVSAARRLHRSPAAVTRAVAALEDRLATRLLNRTTRAVALTDAGARYLDRCRRALAEFEALELSAASERTEPRGLLTVTAPEIFGRLHVLPIAQAFLGAHDAVRISLLLLDRVVSLVDEGIDVGVRIAHLPDSSLRAIHVGDVWRVACASPRFLATRGTPKTPKHLGAHDVITVLGASRAGERWPQAGSRLTVNTMQAALDAAIAGGGVVRVFSYQAEAYEAAGDLRRVLRDHEPPPIPIHVIHPAGRHLPAKTRLFIDQAVASLRAKFGNTHLSRRDPQGEVGTQRKRRSG